MVWETGTISVRAPPVLATTPSFREVMPKGMDPDMPECHTTNPE